MIPERVARLAEDPAAFGDPPPPGGGVERVLADEYCLLLGPLFTSVSRLRLAPERVADVVAEVRARTVGQTWETAWWVGASATPSDLPTRLEALGLRPATDAGWEPVGTAMAAVAPPPEAPGVTARKIESLAEFRLAAEIGWEAFDVSGPERERSRAIMPSRYEAERNGAAPTTYLAWVDGRPVGSARALFYGDGVSLLGGAVLADARGRGAYRALVRARWDDAVARGTPALVVTAGAMSRPILERLGFEPVCDVRIFLDGPR